MGTKPYVCWLIFLHIHMKFGEMIDRTKGRRLSLRAQRGRHTANSAAVRYVELHHRRHTANSAAVRYVASSAAMQYVASRGVFDSLKCV